MAILDGLRNGYPQYFMVKPSAGLDPNILMGAAQMMKASRTAGASTGTRVPKEPLDETMPQMTKATGDRYIDRLYNTEAKKKSVYNKALNDRMAGKDQFQIGEEYARGMTEVDLEEADNKKYRNQAINQFAALKAFQEQSKADKTGELVALIGGRPAPIAYDKSGKQIEAFVQKRNDEGMLAFNEDRTRTMIVNPSLGAFMTNNQYYDYVNSLENFDEKGMPNNIPLPTLYDPNIADEKSYARVRDWANKNNSRTITTTGGVPPVNADGTPNETDPMGGSVRTNFEQITAGILNSPSMVMGSQTELNSALGNYWKAVEGGGKIAVPNTDFEKTPEFTDLSSAVMSIESAGKAKAVSKVGAVGTMQTMPDTLKNPGYGVKPAKDDSDAEKERVGKDYLKAMLDKYDGNVDHALAAYNAGPAYVDAWLKPEGEKTTIKNYKGENIVILGTGGDINKLYSETRKYIPAVKERLAKKDSGTYFSTITNKDIYEAGFPQWVASRATGMSMPLQERQTTEVFKNPSVSGAKSPFTEENYQEVVSNPYSFKAFDRNPTVMNFVDTQSLLIDGAKFKSSPALSVRTYNLPVPPPGVRTQMERTLRITGEEKTMEEYPSVFSNDQISKGGSTAYGFTLDPTKYPSAKIVSWNGNSLMPVYMRDINRKQTQELEANRDDNGNILLRPRMTGDGKSEMVKDVLKGPKDHVTLAIKGEDIISKGLPVPRPDQDANDEEVDMNTLPVSIQEDYVALKHLKHLSKLTEYENNSLSERDRNSMLVNDIFAKDKSSLTKGESIDQQIQGIKDSMKIHQENIDKWKSKSGLVSPIANNWIVENIGRRTGPYNTLLREVSMKKGIKTYGEYASDNNKIKKDSWYELEYYVDREATQGFDISSTKQNTARQFALSNRLRGLVPESAMEADSVANNNRQILMGTAVQAVTQDSTTTR